MKQKLFLALFINIFAIGIISPAVSADTTLLVPHSWDQGLFATKGTYDDSAHSWGQRATSGAWGTGGVNYQSGSTTNWRAASSGSLNV